MKVFLAGYNIDKTLVDSIAENPSIFTPETISAAYARISRDPRPIDELRRSAIEDLDKARKSNKSIVFGMGHSSIAEHAVLNFDIIGISRLALEAVQSHRLNSYTEKSQRYIKIDEDYIIPREITDIGKKKEFREVVSSLFKIYGKLLDSLLPYFLEKCPESQNSKREKDRVEGLAKEDARYVLPLATTAQMGMTINARNLEYLIRSLATSKLQETRSLSKKLHLPAKELAPSLIKYTEPTKYPGDTVSRIAEYAQTNTQMEPVRDIHEDVNLLSCTDNGESKVIAALLAPVYGSFTRASDRADKMKADEKLNFFKDLLRDIQPWDKPPREFELIDFTFELMISSSCFAQLKRHRIATILSSPYQTDLGYTIPESIIQIGGKNLFLQAVSVSEDLYNKIKQTEPIAAQYALTNAHRRKVIMKMNAREMYHFSRLREDEHAQWDIRYLADKIMNIARKKMPALFFLSGGKHEFEKIYSNIYD